VGTGLLLLIWLPTLRCPSAITAVAGVIAQGSLYIYLTHFQIYPLFSHPVAGVVAALLVGSGLAWAVTALRRHIGTVGRPQHHPAAAPRRDRLARPAA
jgi:hypothetical protein